MRKPEEYAHLVCSKQCLDRSRYGKDSNVKRMAEQKPDKSRMPQKILGTPEASLPALLCKSGIFRSHSEARTAIANGYISINFERETDPKRIIGQEDMNSDGSVLLSRGKRDTTTIFFDKDE
jgi:tyrosyl-tRNA synthetase